LPARASPRDEGRGRHGGRKGGGSPIPEHEVKIQPAVRRYEPLVPAAIALVAGIVVADAFGGGMLAWCGLAIAAAAVWAGLCLAGLSPRWLMLPLLVFVAAVGAARFHAAVDPPPDDVARLVADGRRLATVEGVVARSARQNSPPDEVFLPTVPYYVHSIILIDCTRAEVERRWVPARGRVSVTVRQAIPAGGRGVPDLGDRIRVAGVLMPMGKPANPGAFDVAGYLQRQGTRASLSTDHWEALTTIEPRADKVGWLLGAMQRWAVAQLDHLPSEEGRAVVASMLFGRRDLMDFDSGEIHGQDIQRAFLATGTTQFLAVSGFNVALVVSPILLMMRLLRFGRRTTAVVVAAAVLAFVMMTELEPPVLRAAILFWVVCLAWLVGREAVHLNTVAGSVVLIVILRPGDLFTTSFQLSFLAVLGLLFVVGRLESLVLAGGRVRLALAMAAPRKFWYRTILKGMMMVSVAACVVTIPLQAARFHLVAWQAPVANAILAPLVWLLTVAGMVLVAVGWISPWVAWAASIVPDLLGRLISLIVRGLAAVPGGYIYVADISPYWIMLTYGLLVAWVWRARLKISRRRLGMVALAAAAVFVWTGGHHPPPHLAATFVAVGSGNTNLLELPNGRTILYDAGSALSHVKATESAIAPALWSRGIERIDAVFISHAHFDHFKDILPLAGRFRIRQVFVPPTFMRARLKSDNTVIEALLAHGIRVEVFGAGDRLTGTGGVEIAGLWPRGYISMTRAINDGSLVLAVASEGRRLLLTGDLMPAGIDGLLAAEPDVKADAMLWPHHGHDPAAVARLAARTGARTLVISSSRLFVPPPAPPWLKEHAIACYRTGEVGAVTLEFRPDGVRASTFHPAPVAIHSPDAPSPWPDRNAGDD